MRKRVRATRLSALRALEVALITLVCICSTQARAQSNQSALAQTVFQSAKSKVFQIKSATGADAPKASYGSAWVLDRKGLLITNYHVVSESVQKPKKAKLFVLINEKPIEAKVLAVDITHDLALVSVAQTFESSLKLASAHPKQGAKIFSIGLPEDLNMSITEGNYNNIIEYGPYQLIHMASPLNPGMSGGPTLNQDGEVVGVNVSVLMSRQSISFAVPSHFVSLLLQRAKSLDPKNLHVDIEQQLKKVQDELTTNALSSPLPQASFAHWKIQSPSNILKCWSDNEEDPKDIVQTVKQVCYLPHAAFIDSSLTSGSYELSWEAVESKKLASLQLYQVAAEVFNSEERYASLFLKTFLDKDDLLTKYECREALYKNNKQMLFTITTCLRGYVKYETLLNVDFKAVTLSRSKQALVLKLALSGFTLSNSKKMIEHALESIEPIETKP